MVVRSQDTATDALLTDRLEELGEQGGGAANYDVMFLHRLPEAERAAGAWTLLPLRPASRNGGGVGVLVAARTSTPCS